MLKYLSGCTRPAIIAARLAAARACLSAVAGLATIAPGLGACSATPPRPAPTATSARSDAARDLQCTLERPTGSLIATKVCTTKAQRDAIANTSREVGDQIQHARGSACPSTPGCSK